MRTTNQMKLISQMLLLEERIEGVMTARFGDMFAV
jgi:hypothetical protein